MLVDRASLDHAVHIAVNIISTYGMSRTRWKHPVWNVPIAFDTETTNYHTYDDRDVGWCYIWMLRVGDPLTQATEFFYGRDLGLFDSFLSGLAQSLIEEKELLLIYVQNLGFDIEFIRDRLDIVKELSESPHEPIFIRDARGIEFRDSKILSGGLSLKRIGEELNNGLVKKSGDLNYDLIRTPLTPLTEEEMGYCQGDVDVLSSYIAYQIRLYNGLVHVPLTNTGRVRNHAREVIFGRSHFNSKMRYWELMKECSLTYDEYNECHEAFAGGYTHGNVFWVGKVIHDVLSFDEGSAYPTAMLTEKFPMSAPEHVEYDEKSFREWVNDPDTCLIFRIQFRNIRLREGVGDCYLSNDANRCIMQSPISDNGRIRSCERYATTMTDVDFKIISKCYIWDEMSVSDIMRFRADYLPSQVIGIVLDLYNAKTTLKGVKGMEDEYQVKKGMLNSMYGMCVTGILRDLVEVSSGQWTVTPLTDEEKRKNIDKNNKSMNRFLYYPWGVFITAYARFNLWTAILSLGNDYIYSDTDSIKVLASSERLQSYLDRYHHDLMLKFSWMLEKRKKFSMEDLAPCDITGKKRQMGIWDYEGRYELFKTLGSKRYITYSSEDGIDPTVAGISPKMLRAYLMRRCSTPQEMIDMFTDGLHVPADETGKLASLYYEDVDMTVEDYLGKECHVKQRYGVNLKPVDFTLTMTGSFLDLIKMIQGVM